MEETKSWFGIWGLTLILDTPIYELLVWMASWVGMPRSRVCVSLFCGVALGSFARNGVLRDFLRVVLHSVSEDSMLPT